MKLRGYRFFLCLTALSVAACSRVSPSPALGKVNGEVITVADFQKALTLEQWKFGSEIGFRPERYQEVKKSVLETVLKERLLLQEAVKRGIDVPKEEVKRRVAEFKAHYPTPADFERFLSSRGMAVEDFSRERWKELMIQRLTDILIEEKLPLSEADLRKYYEAHPGEFAHGEQVHARQIVTDAAEKAQAVKALLAKGTSFEAAAARYSLSPDRRRGGDLGWFERGVMPYEFDMVCFRLQPGDISDVVGTPYGHHLFEILDRRPAGRYPFEEVKEKILEKLKASEGEKVFREWYAALRGRAEIDVDLGVLRGI